MFLMSFPFYTLLLVANKMSPLSGMIKNLFKPAIYGSCQNVSTKQCCSELRPAGRMGIEEKLGCSSLKNHIQLSLVFVVKKNTLELCSLPKVCYHTLSPRHPLCFPVGFSFVECDKQCWESIPLSLTSVYG